MFFLNVNTINDNAATTALNWGFLIIEINLNVEA